MRAVRVSIVLPAGALDAAFQRGALGPIALAVLAMMAVVLAHCVAAGRAIRNFFHFTFPVRRDDGFSLLHFE